jgi:hypothetical protein
VMKSRNFAIHQGDDGFATPVRSIAPLYLRISLRI